MTPPNDQPAEVKSAPSAGQANGRARLRAIGRPQPSLATWQKYFHASAAWVAEKFAHPRVRLCGIGIALLLLGGFGVIGSMWTLPLMIIGAVMVVIAWIGSRLNGRFAVEWGESGTQLEFRARIEAPAVSAPALPAAEPEPAAPAIWIPPHAETEDPGVIEGEAHTVEIDVAELKALIAAAEALEPNSGGAQRATVQPASGQTPPAEHEQRPAA